MTIDIIHNEILLLIFHFVRATYLDPIHEDHKWRDEARWRLSWWHPIVHVCRNWRFVAFASPNFLDLKLVCSHETPLELIGIWPPFPIIIKNTNRSLMPEDYDFDAAFVHRDRICEIKIYLSSSQLQRLAPMMQEKFPALTHLGLDLDLLHNCRRTTPALPDGFLGGSAPSLKSLWLRSIPFPALPNLLLSTTGLVHLALVDLPYGGYISSEVIVTALAVLPNLESFTIEFMSPSSFPDWETRHPLPQTRTALPALTSFKFRGVSEYLEDFVARIDTPLLSSIHIAFFYQLIFDIPLLAQFMKRTTTLRALSRVHVDFGHNSVCVGCHPPRRGLDQDSGLQILCAELDQQLLSLAQLFTLFFPSIYMVEHLYIYIQSLWKDNTESMQWLEFFHPFTAAKSLYVSKPFVQCIAPALQKVARECVTEVLPALEGIFLEGPRSSGPAQKVIGLPGELQEAIGQFVAARQLLGHPVAVFPWDRTVLDGR